MTGLLMAIGKFAAGRLPENCHKVTCMPFLRHFNGLNNLTSAAFPYIFSALFCLTGRVFSFKPFKHPGSEITRGAAVRRSEATFRNALSFCAAQDVNHQQFCMLITRRPGERLLFLRRFAAGSFPYAGERNEPVKKYKLYKGYT